jgi:hypothetical protein
MKDYLFTSAIICLVLGLTWSKNDLLNLMLKLLFIALGIWGFFLWFIEMGFVIKR